MSNNKKLIIGVVIAILLIVVIVLVVNRKNSTDTQENVNTEILLRICNALDCDIADIMEIERG